MKLMYVTFFVAILLSACGNNNSDELTDEEKENVIMMEGISDSLEMSRARIESEGEKMEKEVDEILKDL